MRYDYDLIVVGGGPGGYVAALYAAHNGLTAAVIEKDRRLGGTCLNRGCIPMKTLLHSSSLWSGLKDLGRWGVHVERAGFDFSAMQRKKAEVMERLTGGVGMLLDKAGVRVVRGSGRVLDANRVSVRSGGGESVTSARNVIIATGSKPSRIRVPGIDLPGVLDSDQALELTDAPKSLIVIGGGVIGLELGGFYASLGCATTVVEALPRIVDRFDADVSAGLLRALRKKGMTFHTGCAVRSIEEDSSGLRCVVETESGTRTLAAEKALVAVGRAPVLDVAPELGLAVERGFVKVDDRMETSVEGLFAIGDVTGKMMLAHVASHQGMVAVDTILGHNRRARYAAVPSCLYTNPEASGVGLTEVEARERHERVKVSVFPFSASGKARTMGEDGGFVKIVAEERYGRVVGAHILGAGATELIAELALAVEMECTAEELAHTVHAHPTLAEGVMEASLQMLGFPLHNPA